MAGRIPPDFISDLLARVDIVEIIDARVKLKKRGNNHIACCPFHQEKTPSFSVNQSKQFFHCFGCGESGNAIGFLMKYDRLEFVDAVEDLAASQGLDVPYESQQNHHRLHRDIKVNYHELMDKIAIFYQQRLTLPDSKLARDYLSKRGLSEEIIKTYRIGYAKRQQLLANFGKTQENLELLATLGMLGQSEDKKYYERFRDRIMFPIRDKRGRTIGYGGRILDEGMPKYLNSPETVLFQKSRHLYGLFEVLNHSQNLTKIIVVEGYMDVVALAQFGVNNAVATLGTATSKEHIQLLFRSVDTIVCCYDGDKAGREAASRALHAALPLLEDGRQIQFAFLPDGEDPDSLVRKIGKEAFYRLIDEAMSYDTFMFEMLGKGKDLTNKQGITKLSAEAIPLIDSVPGITHQVLLKRTLGNKLGIIDTQQLEHIFQGYRNQLTQKQRYEKKSPSASRMMHNTSSGNTSVTTQTPSFSKKMQGAHPLVHTLLALLVQNPKLADLVPSTEGLDETVFPALKLFNGIITLCQKKKGLTTGQLLPLLEASPLTNDFPDLMSTINSLGAWPHDILDEHIEETFLEALAKLYDELLVHRLDILIAKERGKGKLTPEEQQELFALMIALKKDR